MFYLQPDLFKPYLPRTMRDLIKRTRNLPPNIFRSTLLLPVEALGRLNTRSLPVTVEATRRYKWSSFGLEPDAQVSLAKAINTVSSA